MTLDEARIVVSKWAQDKRQIRRIFFFGSRVRGEQRANSDLDVAVELEFSDPDVCLAHWTFDEPKWRSDLAAKLPWSLDLQLFQAFCTPTVASGVDRSSVVVFERNPP